MTDEAKVDLITNEENATVVGVGELDLRISNEFEQLLSRARQSGLPVVVDFTSTDFIDSAILAVLARVGTGLLKENRRLRVLVANNKHPQYVLKTVGFHELMDIVASEDTEKS